MQNQTPEQINDFELPPIPDVEEFDMAEWVIQFDEEDPIVIAWSNTEEEAGELSFIIKPNSGSNVIFKSADGSKTMKLYARRMSELRRQELRNLREQEAELLAKYHDQSPSDEI